MRNKLDEKSMSDDGGTKDEILNKKGRCRIMTANQLPSSAVMKRKHISSLDRLE